MTWAGFRGAVTDGSCRAALPTQQCPRPDSPILFGCRRRQRFPVTPGAVAPARRAPLPGKSVLQDACSRPMPRRRHICLGPALACLPGSSHLQRLRSGRDSTLDRYCTVQYCTVSRHERRKKKENLRRQGVVRGNGKGNRAAAKGELCSASSPGVLAGCMCIHTYCAP